MFIAVAVAPSINANVSRLPIESKSVETSVRIHRASGITPYTVKLSEKESDEIDRLFENIQASLDSAETEEETDEIFNDAVVSLYELGLFPKDMTVEEAQQLVNGKSVKTPIGNLGTGDENFNCKIAGQTTVTYMFDLDKPFWNDWLEFWRTFFAGGPESCWRRVNLPRYRGKIGQISFGFIHLSEAVHDYYPSNGWVWTNGSNGVVKWNGLFYGNIGKKLIIEDLWFAVWEWVYIGVVDFEGLFIDSWGKHPCYLGNAEHVSLTYNQPPPPEP